MPGMLALLQALSLAVMITVLATGSWKPQPLLFLALPLASGLAWWPALRDRQQRSWWFAYVGGLYVYTMLRAFADEHGFPVQVGYVIAIEELIFNGAVPTVTLQRTLFSPASIGWLDVGATMVHSSFFIVPHAAAAMIWMRSSAAFARYVLTVLGTIYAGLVIFFLVPTVPPWLASAGGDIPSAHRIINFVGRGVDAETYRQLHAALAEPNSVAAVPSIHMALTFVLVLWARRQGNRALLAVTAIYSAVMAVSLVYLGEHYAFDVVAGVLVVVAVDIVVHRLWPLDANILGGARDGAEALEADLVPAAPPR
ncbi:MAG: phosphatase PAP2 family protein [Dehalococcoidia bacterium]|nr:phosphatase PAP2 family protein [Dehalococcoidia bacterium]